MGEGPSSVERLKEEIRRRVPVLSINQMPDWALKEFLDFAQDEFKGDRGMALTALLMDRKVMNSEAFIAFMQDLDSRLKALEEKAGLNTVSGKVIKLANGKELHIG